MSISRQWTIPQWASAPLAAEARRFMFEGDGPRVDFRTPEGEAALISPDSIAWQVFKNPVTLFIGGITAVLLELAEPRVRSGVWNHTTFRTDPVPRLRRTGLAAMVTVYGAKSRAEAMIAGVRKKHDRVSGTTPAGVPYSANDLELLDWVQTTAQFGFLEAYRHYARPLSDEAASRFYAEGMPAAKLYGAVDAPASELERLLFFNQMASKLEPSPVIFEFLDIMKAAPLMPRGTRFFQAMLVRAGVEIVPDWVLGRLDIGEQWRLGSGERRLVSLAAGLADRMPLRGTPPVEACLRLGLPPDYLYKDWDREPAPAIEEPGHGSTDPASKH